MRWNERFTSWTCCQQMCSNIVIQCCFFSRWTEKKVPGMPWKIKAVLKEWGSSKVASGSISIMVQYSANLPHFLYHWPLLFWIGLCCCCCTVTHDGVCWGMLCCYGYLKLLVKYLLCFKIVWAVVFLTCPHSQVSLSQHSWLYIKGSTDVSRTRSDMCL